ncbi:transcription factor MYB3R-5-like isoform X2 [Asparagus officinalis]|uniref:transcription factor MYB3R-5-like isoform X2 n=1 Tax=Asparagus officinalis TaxID=4686 RepID=UPI00098E3CD1|nr:transcription factor MYB3R-5-like isoform X2 [Asparagus officinalis]
MMGGDLKRDSDGDYERRASTVAQKTCGPMRRSTKGNWTPEEDALLTESVKKHNGKNWKSIAKLFKNRTDVQCLHRWQKVLDPELVKGAWTKEEDDLILSQVKVHGTKNWSVVAKSLPGRIGKQCRERWHNHLNPAIKKDAWTKDEEKVLIWAQNMYGNRWAEIAKHIPGRSDNSIKNHWNCSLKKRCDLTNVTISHNLKNYLSEPQPQKSDRRPLEPKQASDCCSPNLEVSSLSQASSIIERQEQNGSPSEVLCTHQNDENTIFSTPPSVSSKNFSTPEANYQQAHTPVYNSTTSDLSVSISSSPISFLSSYVRSAAKDYELPSILSRPSQHKRAVDENDSTWTPWFN